MKKSDNKIIIKFILWHLNESAPLYLTTEDLNDLLEEVTQFCLDAPEAIPSFVPWSNTELIDKLEQFINKYNIENSGINIISNSEVYIQK